MENNETLAACIDRLGLSIHAEFVPFSQSRNAKPDAKPSDRSLNWRVTLVRHYLNGNGDARSLDILTTDYSAGVGHCPSYRYGMRWNLENATAIEFETEKGRRAPRSPSMPIGRNPILPDPVDVIASLALDSEILDYAGFEQWADEFGYDPDSRKAEAIYSACLQNALHLRVGLGEQALSELREAAREY